MTEPQLIGLPLRGVRVIEFASFVAGPSAGKTLAQWGAEVIRVDPLGGAADYRRWPLSQATGESLYWNSLNRGKRSVTLDLRSEAGRDLLLALATAPGPDAGILLDNAVGRHWLAYDELTARRADAIALRIQGRSDGGPAVDYTVNSAVGVADLTGPEHSAEPVNAVLPAWDLLCGQEAVAGLLAALRRRDRTGAGTELQIALADVAAAAVADLGWFSEAAERGDRPRQGNHLYGAFGVDFVAADGGRVMVAVLTPRQWQALCATTGTTEVLAALGRSLGADLDTDDARFAHREVIAAILRPWFSSHTTEQVHAALTAGGVLWGPYRTPAGVVADFVAEPASEPVLTWLDQPGIGPVVSASSPVRFDDEYTGTAPAPRLGADTGAVLHEVLGLGDAELAKLRSAGVIAPATDE